MAVHTFVVPTRVLSGPGAVAEIGPTLSAEGHKRILIVTDEGIVNAGLLAPVTRSLQGADVAADCFRSGKSRPGRKHRRGGCRGLSSRRLRWAAGSWRRQFA